MVFVDHKITYCRVEEPHILNGTGTLVPEVFAIFCKKSFIPSFLPCSSNFCGCFFLICLAMASAWFIISAFNLRYFSTSWSTLSNSVGEISPSCIACEMILDMLSNLLWARNLMESCFSRLTLRGLEDFRMAVVITERNRLAPPKAIPAGNPTPFANAAIDIPPVIAVNVIRSVSTMLAIVMNRFIFLALCSRFSISLRKYASISNDISVVLLVVL